MNSIIDTDEALADLIAEKTVSVEEVDRDRYGRVVARVTIDGRLVNAEMVQPGRHGATPPTIAAISSERSRPTPAGNAANCGPTPTPSPPGSGGGRRRTARRPGRPWGWGGR